MVFFDWDEKLSVGVPSIDTQHKKLVELINTLFEAMHDKKTTQIVGSLVRELSDYTRYHFSEEERLMEKASFSGLLLHKKEHANFIAKVQDVQQKIDKGQSNLIGFDLANFLKSWLKDHITGTDQSYAAVMRAAGMK
jgi:hemerythrin-like metal-binding protein